MPRPKTPALTYQQLVATLGSPMRERAEFVTLDVTTLAPPRRVHRGWSWPCGCAAFAREEHDRYLYVPCVGHTAARRGAQHRGAAEARTGS